MDLSKVVAAIGRRDRGMKAIEAMIVGPIARKVAIQANAHITRIADFPLRFPLIL